MRETLKIRHYVVGVIYHAGERSVQIMSSRDLAKYFNIARSTVSIALKELVDQGYLIPVKGKGYFTNPRKIMTPIPGKMPPLILLIHGDGRNFYHNSQAWESISTIGKAVTDAGFYFRQLTLSSTGEEELFNEIRGAQADGLIWIDRLYYDESLLKRLTDDGMPVICDALDSSAVNTVYFDTPSACRKIGQRLAREKKTNILYCLGKWHRENDLPYILEPFSKAGLDVHLEFVDNEGLADRDKLTQGLLRRKWDVVFSHPPHVPLLSDAIRLTGIPPPELLARLYLRNTPERQEEFRFPFRKRAEATVQRMIELLYGDRRVKQISIPMEAIKQQIRVNQKNQSF